MADLHRRGFLLGSGAALLLAACNSGDSPTLDGADTTEPPDTTGATTTTTAAAGSGVVLGTAFNRNTFLESGIPQRSTFVLFDRAGGFVTVDEAPAELTVTGRSGAQEISGTVARHGDELDRPYYPLELTFPASGVWTVEVDLPDGTSLSREIAVNDAVTFPQIGAAMPSVATPTVADPLGVGTICTREPQCPFHDVSLDAALADGRPVAALVSTPAYCQVAICGPVLDLLIGADVGDLAVIHIEAFPNGSGTNAGPASTILTDDFGLDFEPVLYVADATGTITARLDSIFDSAELTTALGSATS